VGKEIINGKETYHLRSKIISNRFFAKFYYLSEQIDTMVGILNLLPVHVIKNVDCKKYRKCYEFSVDHENQKATITSKHHNTIKTVAIPPITLDSLSLIYYLRNQNLNVGNSYNLGILTNHGVEQVKVNIVKKEKVSTPDGEFVTLKAIQSDGDTTVWFTTDKKHIPVKIKVKTKAGELKAYLRKTKGLK